MKWLALLGGAGHRFAVERVLDERVRARRPVGDQHGSRVEVDDESGVGHGLLGHRQALIGVAADRIGPAEMIGQSRLA